MSTTYNENVVFSISSLLLKNKQYKEEIERILANIASPGLYYEKFIVDTMVGNKVVKSSVAKPDVTKIALDNIKDLAHRIKENNVMIRKLVKEQPAYESDSEEAIAIKHYIREGVKRGNM